MVGYTPSSPVAQVEVVKVATVTNAFNYSVTINGETAVYLSDSDATAAEIVAGLVSAINGLVGAANYTAAATDRLSITSDVAGQEFTLELGTVKLTKPQFEVITVDTVTDNFKYTLLVNGVEASFTSGVSTTAQLIRDGLLTSLATFLAGMGITATSISTDKFSLEHTTELFTITVGTTKL